MFSYGIEYDRVNSCNLVEMIMMIRRRKGNWLFLAKMMIALRHAGIIIRSFNNT